MRCLKRHIATDIYRRMQADCRGDFGEVLTIYKVSPFQVRRSSCTFAHLPCSPTLFGWTEMDTDGHHWPFVLHVCCMHSPVPIQSAARRGSLELVSRASSWRTEGPWSESIGYSKIGPACWLDGGLDGTYRPTSDGPCSSSGSCRAGRGISGCFDSLPSHRYGAGQPMRPECCVILP
jgi:hypothetical protein